MMPTHEHTPERKADSAAAETPLSLDKDTLRDLTVAEQQARDVKGASLCLCRPTQVRD